MNLIPTMTATQPAFGMPTYGPTSARSAVIGMPATAAATAHVSTCARMRLEGTGLVGSTTAGAGVKGDFPGTSAWRPPIC